MQIKYHWANVRDKICTIQTWKSVIDIKKDSCKTSLFLFTIGLSSKRWKYLGGNTRRCLAEFKAYTAPCIVDAEVNVAWMGKGCSPSIQSTRQSVGPFRPHWPLAIDCKGAGLGCSICVFICLLAPNCTLPTHYWRQWELTVRIDCKLSAGEFVKVLRMCNGFNCKQASALMVPIGRNAAEFTALTESTSDW